SGENYIAWDWMNEFTGKPSNLRAEATASSLLECVLWYDYDGSIGAVGAVLGFDKHGIYSQNDLCYFIEANRSGYYKYKITWEELAKVIKSEGVLWLE
ncbi:MAG: hypothetical protein ACWGQW_23255, partial [bacterium]